MLLMLTLPKMDPSKIQELAIREHWISFVEFLLPVIYIYIYTLDLIIL